MISSRIVLAVAHILRDCRPVPTTTTRDHDCSDVSVYCRNSVQGSVVAACVKRPCTGGINDWRSRCAVGKHRPTITATARFHMQLICFYSVLFCFEPI
ncbi:hypothetical protein BDZ89DRAFT_562326 [Hymenopellis radicata]|nr:hypothetical protein BDZ89DRAFT_562326 [Hymenopellis radicata]